MFPLKKVGDRFERIPWEQAIDEIGEKLSAIVNEYGPRTLALMMGGGAIGCPSQGAFAANVLRGMGSQYFYSALAQELTGRYWVDGKTLGSQNLHSTPHLDKTDMLLTVGWNPMMSHHTPQARRVLTRFKKDPHKILVVVDPRLSETAQIADIHLPIRPGTDALFYRAAISIIFKERWHDEKYVAEHVNGFEKIQPWFIDFDEKAALNVCGLDYNQVKEVCRLFTTRKSSHHSDLGVLMTRHSTLISYLENVFRAITGRIGVEGGNIFPIGLRGGGSTEGRETPDEREARMWRTVVTDYPAIVNSYPPNAMPEEIMSDNPNRLRAVLVTTCNPLRSYADTTAFEEAFKTLDLLVTVDPSLTETAAISHYVLPALSGYESWDGGIRPGFPKVFMQLQRPVVEPEGEQLEGGEIFLRLADRLGLIPEIPEALNKAADNEDRLQFGAALMAYLQSNPKAARNMPYILGKTLGKKLGSVHLASLWGILQNLTQSFQEMAERVGFHPGHGLGEEIFQAVIEHPQGLWIGEADVTAWDHFQALATKDGRINLDVPEMDKWIQEIDPVRESKTLEEDKKRFPFVMSAGRHCDVNANTQMRDPDWNQGKRACTASMHPEDAQEYGFIDGQMVRIITEAGKEEIEIEVTKSTMPGYIMIPHGFGLVFQGKAYGANANRLAKNTHRDPVAGTPLHRYIPCRVEPI